MKTYLKILPTTSFIIVMFCTSALAQWDSGYADPFDTAIQQLQQENYAYEQNLNQWMQQAQAQDAQFYAYLINLYRQSTGDYNSPDQVAMNQGWVLHCQQYPTDCQGAAASAQANTGPNSVADIMHQGWRQRNAAQDQGHANYVQGAIQDESNYQNASTGMTFSLPNNVQTNTLYATPEGMNVMFDGVTWYQVDQYGYGTPLQSY